MDVEKTLEDVGLSKNEVKVYVALSKLGEATANAISTKSKVHRTNVYDTLDRLAEKGLVSYIHKEGTKYFRITDPEQLVFMLEEKKRKVEQIIPELKVSKILEGKASYAEVLEGVKSFCNILENFLSYEEEILAYGIPHGVPERVKHFISGFHKRRIAKKIIMKHIYNYDAHERIEYLKTLDYTEAERLEEEYDSRVVTNICGDEVVFTLWNEKIWSVRVINRELADSYKRYFYVLFERAKKKSH